MTDQRANAAAGRALRQGTLLAGEACEACGVSRGLVAHHWRVASALSAQRITWGSIESGSRRIAKKEPRQVPCEDVANFAGGVVETIRVDTGDIVATRPLREDERQMEFPS